MNMKNMVFAVLILAALAISFNNVTVKAEDSNSSEISKKLDDVLANQQSIISDLAVIKEEIRILKMRVTQQQ